ncbi:MAG: gliding motility protein GldN [Chitinophagaceae bacterium]
MKNLLIKVCCLVVLITTFCMDVDAQRRSRRRGSTTPTTQPQGQNQQQQNNNSQSPVYNPYGNVPIEAAPAVGGYSDSVRKSLRPDGATDRTLVGSERTPLAYEHLRADDALYVERVWRELDLREKMNQPFRSAAEDDFGSQKFVNILLSAVKSGKVTAFADVDDRFTTPLDSAGVNITISGSATNDTTAVYNLDDPTKIDKYVVTSTSFNPDDVMKIRIKEEWVFDREASRMFVRILGIAPLRTSYRQDGSERGAVPMFWIYYPDLRPILANYEVYNPKNMGIGRMTWEELFEARMFSSYIVKSTLDNPYNRDIKGLIRDPILRLLEGENIKDRIFNYEQDLWSY